MLTLVQRRGLTAIVFALVAAACSSTATDTTETTTTTSAVTTTTAATTTTGVEPTTTTAPATTTTAPAGGSSGTGAIIDAARPYVTPGGDQYDFVPVTDDSETLSVSLPTVWADIDGTAWFDDNDRRSGPSITAAASIDTFYSDFSAPGIFVGTSDILVDEFGPGDLTEQWGYSASCTLTSTDPVSTGALDGRLAVWTDCNDTGGTLLTFAATPPDEAFLTLMISIVLTETDVEAFTIAIDTLTTDVGSIEALSSSEVAELVSMYVGAPTGGSETGFIEVQDDAETLTVRVPSNWVETESSPWEVDGVDVGTSVVASPDLESYYTEWGIPGVFYAVSEELAAPDDLGVQLDRYQFSDSCTDRGRYPFSGMFYTGAFDLWTECDEPASAVIVMEAYRPDKPFLAYLEIVVASPEDLAALETVLDSFDVLRQS